jgi:hypothetical protein
VWSGNYWWGYSNFCGPYYRDWRWGWNPTFRNNLIHRQGPRTTYMSSGSNLSQMRRSLDRNSVFRTESSPRRNNFFTRGRSTSTPPREESSYSRSRVRESVNTPTPRTNREYRNRSSYRETPTTTPRINPTTPRTYTPSTPRTYTPRTYTPSTPRSYTPSYTPSTPRTYTPSYTPSTPRTYTPRTYTPSTPRTYTPSTPRTYTPSYTPSTPRTYTPRTYTPSTPRTYTPSTPRTSPTYRTRE